LDNPYWADDADFDIAYHVRELALPNPGTTRQLTEQVARLHARPVDMSRPLWELYLITGLEDERAAIYVKIHHAIVDGVGGNAILAALLDTTPHGRTLPEPAAVDLDQPSPARMVGRSLAALAGRPGIAARLAANLVRATPALVASSAPELPVLNRLGSHPERDSHRTGPALRAPKTPFNAPISAHRRVAFAEVPLAEIRTLRQATEATVNDVVLAMCAGGLRRWLADRDTLPAAPLVGGIPISVRSEDQHGDLGNQVSAMLTAVPTHLDDPAARLAAASRASRTAKQRFDATPASLFTDAAQLGIPAVTAPAYRRAARLGIMQHARPFNLVISNVPGPKVPLYLAGAEVLAYYPLSAITDGQALNITVFSYRDTLHIGLTACRKLTPDLDALATAISDEIHTLVAAHPAPALAA
jgi:WS/DGAT/MGAT family acyltransferase